MKKNTPGTATTVVVAATLRLLHWELQEAYGADFSYVVSGRGRVLAAFTVDQGYRQPQNEQKRRRDALGRGVRQTSCRHCGQDIEGYAPYRRGEWRDRGNNWHCPTPAGDKGQVHAPVKER